MASFTIHEIDDHLRQRLQHQAAKHGVSAEEEALRILRQSLPESTEPVEHQSAKELYDEIRRIVEPLGGIELEPPAPNLEFPNPSCKESQDAGTG